MILCSPCFCASIGIDRCPSLMYSSLRSCRYGLLFLKKPHCLLGPTWRTRLYAHCSCVAVSVLTDTYPWCTCRRHIVDLICYLWSDYASTIGHMSEDIRIGYWETVCIFRLLDVVICSYRYRSISISNATTVEISKVPLYYLGRLLY
jgi:hypothetical protein